MPLFQQESPLWVLWMWSDGFLAAWWRAEVRVEWIIGLQAWIKMSSAIAAISYSHVLYRVYRLNGNKWLSLWASHWIIQSSVLFKNTDSFNNDTTVLLGDAQWVIMLGLCFEIFFNGRKSILYNSNITLTMMLFFPLTHTRICLSLYFIPAALSSPCPFSYFLSLSEFSIGGKQIGKREGERQISANLCHILTGWNKNIFTFLILTVSLSAEMTVHYIFTFWISCVECNKSALCAQNSL